ncbi:hypothetical protein [Paraburkholderia kururiensis]|uniref:Uncharacterized protein n=1 Tax=Paraburkholderia kururiensis TaxID=984307 RepID=A0ABZ0WR44_9BURK|nr:hypothetical protein [Paraburkholderia kururiensis]WQD79731.1 hypothetical protein U0042_08635 [Paraburkholderia kururiensis]
MIQIKRRSGVKERRFASRVPQDTPRTHYEHSADTPRTHRTRTVDAPQQERLAGLIQVNAGEDRSPTVKLDHPAAARFTSLNRSHALNRVNGVR